MTDVLTEEEKSILVRFASAAEDASILNVIETGVASEQDDYQQKSPLNKRAFRFNHHIRSSGI